MTRPVLKECGHTQACDCPPEGVYEDGSMVTDVAWADDFDLGQACELGDTECESCS